MADRYDRQVKVSSKTIDEIRQLGIAKALEKANSGKAGVEFVEGAKRFYGDRVKAPQKWSESDLANNAQAGSVGTAVKTKPISSTANAIKNDPVNKIKPGETKKAQENLQAAAKRRVEPTVAASPKTGVTQIAENLNKYKGPGLSKSEKEKNVEKYLGEGKGAMSPAEQRASRKRVVAERAAKSGKKPKKEVIPEWKLRAEAREKGHTSYTEREKYVKEQREKGR